MILKKNIRKFLNFFNLDFVEIKKEYNFPVETDENIIEFINTSNEFSLTGHLRMYVLSQAILNVKLNRLEGDFVECGVWRGGNILLYKFLNDYYHLNKSIFGYDTFEGMVDAEPVDINFRGHSASEQLINTKKSEDLSNVHCYSSIDTVLKNILKYKNMENIQLIKGPVEKTLMEEKNLPKKISVLRLDTDWYKSTKVELEILFPRLVSGGVLIIDDYGHWQGAQKAVDEYFDKKEWLHYVDYSCRYLIKK